MEGLNANTKGKVLIPTNERNYPFLIKITEKNWNGNIDVIYLAVKRDGTLTGDGFYESELAKYCPNAEL
jgi:hypothetical protein